MECPPPRVSGLTVNQNSTSTSSRLTVAQMAHVDELCSVSCRGKRLIKHTCVFAHWRRWYLDARKMRARESGNERARDPWDRRAETITRGEEKTREKREGIVNASHKIRERNGTKCECTKRDWLVSASGLVLAMSVLNFAIRLRWRALWLIIEFASRD